APTRRRRDLCNRGVPRLCTASPRTLCRNGLYSNAQARSGQAVSVPPGGKVATDRFVVKAVGRGGVAVPARGSASRRRWIGLSTILRRLRTDPSINSGWI